MRPSYDAIVLAGGRGRRLGGADKAALRLDGEPLLDRALRAVGTARRVVVVGPAPADPPPGVLLTQEEPAYGGPAAAVAAGLRALNPPAEFVLLAAVDVPGLDRLLPVLLDALHPRGGDGAIVVEGGHLQYLACVVRADALLAQLETKDSADGLSMRRLLEPLDLVEVHAPAGAGRDIDTWADAAALGVQAPPEAGR